VSVCIGLVRCDIGEGSGIELLSDAFIALKRAKLAGPGSHQFYTRSIGEETRAHTRILHDLQQALDGQSLHLVYQPQVSLASGQVVGLEALVRWQRDDGSMTRPDQFIPVAERSGMIVALGAWVLRNALAAMRQLAAANHGDLRMAINVSPVQLRDPAFLELVDRILAQNGPRAGQLEFEITESIAALGVERITSLLGEVRKRDIEIAIDDFGTGFSSLSCLDKLPVDRLKIDRSFVAGLGEQGTGGRIAEMIVPLGHCLGISVLAEGVETPGQADILRAMGCDEAQGYLFAKPMPLDSLLGWLQTRKVA
jgi:EAL domain-containing protein (putative c-di-GMP-specific phosphodiesterase class I)